MLDAMYAIRSVILDLVWYFGYALGVLYEGLPYFIIAWLILYGLYASVRDVILHIRPKKRGSIHDID